MTTTTRILPTEATATLHIKLTTAAVVVFFIYKRKYIGKRSKMIAKRINYVTFKRKDVMLQAFAFALVGFTVGRNIPYAPHKNTKTPVCNVVITDASHDTFGFFVGVDYNVATKEISKNEKPLGFAMQEDSIIYPTIEQAKICPQYVRS